MQINFDKEECSYLKGLQYLTDRPELFHDRSKIFDAIRARQITAKQLESSDLYHRIVDKIAVFPSLEILSIAMIRFLNTIRKLMLNRLLNPLT